MKWTKEQFYCEVQALVRTNLLQNWNVCSTPSPSLDDSIPNSIGSNNMCLNRDPYLTPIVSSSKLLDDTLEDSNDFNLNELEDTMLSQCSNMNDGLDLMYPHHEQIYIEWRLSIVYHPVYCVPALYFRVQYLDGTPCVLSELVNQNLLFSENKEDTSMLVSEEEHPMTGLPYYVVHPCQTSDCLDLFCEPNRPKGSILWSWMSMVLQIAQCKDATLGNFRKVSKALS